MQKKFTTDTLPSQYKINRGEKEQYYAYDTNTPLISHEDFERVQTLLNKRKNPNYCIKEYPLSKMIRCRECGSVYTRKLTNNIVYWTCYRHNKYAMCDTKQVAEKSIYSAFIFMFNKLKANADLILKPLIKQLEALEQYENKNNFEYTTLLRNIADLREQAHLMTNLLSNGLLDDNSFNVKYGEIQSKIQEANMELKLLKSNAEDKTLESIKAIYSLLTESDYLSEFDCHIFKQVVKKAEIKDDKITFELISDLNISEVLR